MTVAQCFMLLLLAIAVLVWEVIFYWRKAIYWRKRTDMAVEELDRASTICSAWRQQAYHWEEMYNLKVEEIGISQDER